MDRRRQVLGFSKQTTFLSALLMWSQSVLLISHWGEIQPKLFYQ